MAEEKKTSNEKGAKSTTKKTSEKTKSTKSNAKRTSAAKTISKKPARFSPQDHYGKYRRKLKQLQKNV